MLVMLVMAELVALAAAAAVALALANSLQSSVRGRCDGHDVGGLPGCCGALALARDANVRGAGRGVGRCIGAGAVAVVGVAVNVGVQFGIGGIGGVPRRSAAVGWGVDRAAIAIAIAAVAVVVVAVVVAAAVARCGWRRALIAALFSMRWPMWRAQPGVGRPAVCGGVWRRWSVCWVRWWPQHVWHVWRV